ncbi:VWA domain-containing protein [Reinekea forsetii]|nr:VWA domain-containing protein [Reinekea forsetii]
MTFVRPEWLWLMVVLVPATWYWFRNNQPKSSWHDIISPELFTAIAGDQIKRSKRHNGFLPILLALSIVALAGPAIKNGDVKVSSLGNLVVILDNSLSMAGTDITPDRLTRAKRMLLDWTQSGLFHQTAVILYSGSAHWLTPFTQDSKTLEVQLSPVTPFMMPSLGNRPELAFEALESRLASLPNQPLTLLWLTDDIQKHHIKKITNSLPETSNKFLTVVGTEQGSAIPLPNDNGFLTDGDNMVIAKANSNEIATLGQELGFQTITLGQDPAIDLLQSKYDQKSEISNAQEVGYWLIIPIMILFALMLRAFPNFASAMGVLFFIALPSNSEAFEYESLFLNKDQQAIKYLQTEQFEKALDVANSPEIKGQAAFEMNNYEQAVVEFESISTASGYFNLGNSLAHLGKLEEAISAYENALTIEDHAGALKNKETIEEFIAQQKVEQENTEQSTKDDKSKDPSENQQDSAKSGENAQPSENSNQVEPPESSNDETEEESREDASASSESSNKPPKNAAEGLNSESPKSAEELRAQQQIDAILNQLETTPGYVTQQKFKYQYQQNPTSDEGTLW